VGRGGVPVPKPVSRAADRLERLKAEAQTKRQVAHAVKVRDHYKCRGCRRRGPGHVDVHHLKFRSQGGGDVLENLLCLCRVCHAEIHAYRLRIEGDNANQRLRFVRTA